MKCHPKILCILYEDHVINKKVCAKIQQAIGPHEDLLIIVMRRKLQWYGHVSRSSGLDKTNLQGTVRRGRRQGSQRKRWEENIREWTGLEFGKSKRAVENRKKWRKIVAKSSVVPQRPSRLRDRWDNELQYNTFKTHWATIFFKNAVYVSAHLWPWNIVIKPGITVQTPRKVILMQSLKDLTLTLTEKRETLSLLLFESGSTSVISLHMSEKKKKMHIIYDLVDVTNVIIQNFNSIK